MELEYVYFEEDGTKIRKIYTDINKFTEEVKDGKTIIAVEGNNTVYAFDDLSKLEKLVVVSDYGKEIFSYYSDIDKDVWKKERLQIK